MSERSDRRWLDGETPEPEPTGKAKRPGRKRKAGESETPDAPGKEAEDVRTESGTDPVETAPDGSGDGETRDGTERIPDSEIRKIAAEAAFRRRVELSELRDALGEEAYASLRERYGPDVHWYLEEGPLLLRSVVTETEPEGGPVRKAVVRYAVTREAEPPPPSEALERLVTAFSDGTAAERRMEPEEAGEAQSDPVASGPDTGSVSPPEEAAVTSVETVADRAEGFAREIPADDAAGLVVDTADRGPVFVNIDRGTVEVHETASEDSPVIAERNVVAGPTAPASGRAENVSPEDAERIATEAASEPLADRPRPESGFARTLETLERAWAETRLPPIAGGAPRPGEPGAPERDRPPDADTPEVSAESERPPEDRKEEQVPEPEEESAAPGITEPLPTPKRSEPARPRRPRPPRSRVPTPEFRGHAPEGLPPLPDADTRRRAKRMLRKLAARFGLRLTPDLEGYLMQVVFRLRYVDGKLRRGIGVNVDILMRVMEALRAHYPLYTPPRRS